MVSVFGTDPGFLSVVEQQIKSVNCNQLTCFNSEQVKNDSVLYYLLHHKGLNYQIPNSTDYKVNISTSFYQMLNNGYCTLFWPEQWDLTNVPDSQAIKDLMKEMIIEPALFKNNTYSINIGKYWYRITNENGKLYIYNWIYNDKIAEVTKIQVASNGIIYYTSKPIIEYLSIDERTPYMHMPVFGGTPYEIISNEIFVKKPNYKIV